VEARGPSDIYRAFAVMTQEQAGAVIVLVDLMLLDHRTRIADLAATRRLPAVYGMSDHVEAGGLIAYGPSVLERYRRAAIFVDKFSGARSPATCPSSSPRSSSWSSTSRRPRRLTSPSRPHSFCGRIK
jgi:hypothetical protein